MFPGAQFAQLDLPDGYRSCIAGYIPLGEDGFYLMGVPAGGDWQPPAGLPGFVHYLPSAVGYGYWVRYYALPESRLAGAI